MMKVDLQFSRISSVLGTIEVPDVDLVVGIARGGIVPASLLAFRLRRDLIVIPINYRDDLNQPRHTTPCIGNLPAIPAGVQSILLVDDVAVSGSTLEAARELLRPYDVTTLVLKGTADIVAFPDIKTCVNWPWNTNGISNGRLNAMRLDADPTTGSS